MNYTKDKKHKDMEKALHITLIDHQENVSI